MQLAEGFPSQEGFIFDMHNPKSRESVNYHYLEGHGLVDIKPIAQAMLIKSYQNPTNGPKYSRPGRVTITVIGMDFIHNDGGLTAILGVVTVKLHSETLSALEGKILSSEEIPPEEKTRLLDRLRSLTEEGSKTLIQEMVKAGLSRGPEMWETALRFLSS